MQIVSLLLTVLETWVLRRPEDRLSTDAAIGTSDARRSSRIAIALGIPWCPRNRDRGLPCKSEKGLSPYSCCKGREGPGGPGGVCLRSKAPGATKAPGTRFAWMNAGDERFPPRPRKNGERLTRTSKEQAQDKEANRCVVFLLWYRPKAVRTGPPGFVWNHPA